MIRIEETTPPPVFSERPVEDPPPSARGGIQPGMCPAQIAEYPSPYFDDSILIRLPAGVDDTNLVEFAPGFARNTKEIESVHCPAESPGALIDFMAMVIVPDDRPLENIRDELLDGLGYPEGSTPVEQDYDPAEQAGMWVYDIPADDHAGRPEPAKILLSLQIGHGRTFGLVFEVHPNAWSVMVDTLVASARHVSLLSP